MCRRYLFTSPLEAIQRMVKIDQQPNLVPNYNVAPNHEMPILRRRPKDGRHELAIARWGLIPQWAKHAQIGNTMINARAEAVASEPAFRDAFMKRRCLVPADGFYEWKRKGNQPYLIKLNGGGLFCFAGLWSTWTSPEGREVTSYAIITTGPNELMAPIHGHMPVILGYHEYESWLDTQPFTAAMLKPCPSSWLEAYPVERRLGNVLNKDEGLIRPL